MIRKVLFVTLVLVLVCVDARTRVVHRGHHGHHKGNTSYNWDFMLLVNRWAPNACATTSHCHIPSTAALWNLHGLWPQFNDGSWPSYCDDRKFDESKISDIEDEMKIDWTDLLHSSTTDFWTHEWEKHGVCCGKFDPLSTEHEFFAGALSLHDKLDLQTWLTDANMPPSSSQGYKIDDIINTVQDKLGAKINAQCKGHDGKQLLKNLQFCVNRDMDFYDCPSAAVRFECDYEKDTYLLPGPN